MSKTSMIYILSSYQQKTVSVLLHSLQTIRLVL
nr:MAG TPA_asm: hypothetical protein [Bacteriophage sp.]